MKMMPACCDAVDRRARHGLHVDELLLLFLREHAQRVRHRQAPLPGPALEQAGQHVLDVDVDLFDRRPRDDLERGKALLADLDLDLLVIEPPVAQLFPQLLARTLRLVANGRRLLVVLRRRGQRRKQEIQDAFLGGLPRLLPHFRNPFFLHHVDGELDEVADHRLDIAADVADLGELRRLDLDEGGLRQAREPPRDLGLADARRADHQDVLRRDLLRHLSGQPLAARPVSQRNRDGALRVCLADDVLVELGDDLARRQRLGRRRRCLRKINGHCRFVRSRWRSYNSRLIRHALSRAALPARSVSASVKATARPRRSAFGAKAGAWLIRWRSLALPDLFIEPFGFRIAHSSSSVMTLFV